MPSTGSRSGRSSRTDPVPLALLPRSEAHRAVPVDSNAGSGCGQQVGSDGPERGDCAGVQMLLQLGWHSQLIESTPRPTNRLRLGSAPPDETPCPSRMSALEQSIRKYAEDTQWRQRRRPRSGVKQAKHTQ